MSHIMIAVIWVCDLLQNQRHHPIQRSIQTRELLPMDYPAHKSWKTSRMTGTNSGGFTASRHGDSGNRLAAGEILPPFCVSWGRFGATIDGKVGGNGSVGQYRGLRSGSRSPNNFSENPEIFPKPPMTCISQGAYGLKCFSIWTIIHHLLPRARPFSVIYR